MTQSSNPDPQSFDAVLGGNNSAPQQGAILGGVAGIQQKMTNPDLSIRLEAVDQAWSYGTAGLECLNQALSDRSKTVRRRARWLLRQSAGTGELPPPPPLWNLRERLGPYPGYRAQHATQFFNRPVQEFEPGQTPQDPQQVAFALRCDYDDDDMLARLEALFEATGERVEALVFGTWGSGESVCTGDHSSQGLVELLVDWRDYLPHLKALFIGDINYQECEISWLVQSNMGPILQAYPQLELLQVRGGEKLEFLPVSAVESKTRERQIQLNPIARHEHLKALIIETGGLRQATVQQIYQWELPALEHLELWFGSENYGGDCWEQDLAPILDELKFPNLAYLGLRNAKFTDELMDRLVRSPLLAGLQVLDLSLGTLSDQGAAKLLECPAVSDLEILNVSESYLSGAMIDQLQSLGIQVVAESQRVEEDYDEPEYRRYCAVAE